ncbi:MAG: hypothetical protein R3Y35_12105 [Clostridia bacterium]
MSLQKMNLNIFCLQKKIAQNVAINFKKANVKKQLTVQYTAMFRPLFILAVKK